MMQFLLFSCKYANPLATQELPGGTPIFRQWYDYEKDMHQESHLAYVHIQAVSYRIIFTAEAN
jgi:hypothetical protein